MPGNSPLARDLRQVHSDAVRWRLRHITKTLPRGLKLDVMVGKGAWPHCDETLTISREGVYPSLTEWQAVIAAWPHARIPPEVTPEQKRAGPNFTLRASWRALPKAAPEPLIQPYLLEPRKGGTDA